MSKVLRGTFHRRKKYVRADTSGTGNTLFKTGWPERAFVVSLLGLMVLLCSCVRTGFRNEKPFSQTFAMKDREIGGPIEVRVGQSFAVEMRNPASGGYVLKEPEFDPHILQMRDQKFIPPPENERIAGNFGRVEYVFKAIAPGITEIIFKIYMSCSRWRSL
ncbi:MAG: protease inhibitor I42 family protein [Proteobacteria bacterium]|nr:protease inhibitor I42 family protein [Pseudomonadota bacterium]